MTPDPTDQDRNDTPAMIAFLCLLALFMIFVGLFSVLYLYVKVMGVSQ